MRVALLASNVSTLNLSYMVHIHFAHGASFVSAEPCFYTSLAESMLAHFYFSNVVTCPVQAYRTYVFSIADNDFRYGINVFDANLNISDHITKLRQVFVCIF